ncbi:MAG: hypothetical protein V1897_16725 [Pseudomonadota bacterium]
MNWYRPFASAIDAALKRGWRVECWHHVGTPMPNRSMDFPTIDTAPFPSVKVTFREYRGFEGLSQLMSRKTVDVVVNNLPPVGARVNNWPQRPNRPLYVCLDGSPNDSVYYINDPEELKQTDLFAMTTPHWVDSSIQTIKDIKNIYLYNGMEAELRRRCRPVGWPSIDQRMIVDPAEVRHQWGIPEGQPVVVYLNWVDCSSVGLRPAMFSAISIRDKVAALIRHPKEWRSIFKVLGEPCIDDIMKAIRVFCDCNNAFLIVKHRHRDKVWPSEVKVADKVIGDESYYPHTIWQVMGIADLVMGYFSFAVRESVASKVPYLALDVAGFTDQVYFEKQGPVLRNMAGEKGFFNFPGITRIMNDSKILRDLPRMLLSDFRMDPRVFEEYYAKYLGVPGVANSELFLDEVQKLVEKESSTCL